MTHPYSMTWNEEPSRAASSMSAYWLVSLPVRLEAWLGLTECDSGFGPLVFLQTSLLLSSLRARVTFAERPDERGRVSTSELPLVPAAFRVTPPRQMVRSSRAHPELDLRVRDDSGEALTDHASLGACLNGWRQVDADFRADAEVSLELIRKPSALPGGTSVRLRGELHLSRGCVLRIEFRSPDQVPATGLDVTIAPAGRAVAFPERTARVAWDGDPYLKVILVDDGGLPFGEERFLGRCQAA